MMMMDKAKYEKNKRRGSKIKNKDKIEEIFRRRNKRSEGAEEMKGRRIWPETDKDRRGEVTQHRYVKGPWRLDVASVGRMICIARTISSN